MLSGLKVNPSRLAVLGTLIICAFMNFRCTSSRLMNVWKDPEFKNPPMTNMLIIAANKTPVHRRIWEDGIVAELSAKGVTATPSYRLFADSMPDPEQVAASVQMNKFDGVLFIRKIPTEISTDYVPGPTKSVQFTRYNERTQTYAVFYRDVQQMGYTDTNKVVRHEITVFTSEQEGVRLVWAGTGELINPSSPEEVRQQISDLIAPELARQGIIQGK